jgi:hypothetical protein
VNGVEVVLEPGPINYRDMALYGDKDLEQGLMRVGLKPESTTFRVIEIPLLAIGDVRGMPRWRHPPRDFVDKVQTGAEFPPIVVMPTSSGWTLLDGVTRAYAYWFLGWETVRAYDLIFEQ